MVRINSIVLAGLVAVGAIARPHSFKAKRQLLDRCMTEEEGASVANNFGTLIANYSDALASNALAPNFTDYSESVNTLINTCPQGAAAISLPLLAPTFTSREMFMIGQAQQPAINFNQLNMWVSCDAVIIRWMTTNTAPIANPKPVVGLIAMEVVPNPNATAAVDYPWLIDYVFSEFDAGAWLQNLQEAGICGPAPGPCDSQQVPPEATPSSNATASATATATPTLVATSTVGGGAVAEPSTTSTVGGGAVAELSTTSVASAAEPTTTAVVVEPSTSTAAGGDVVVVTVTATTTATSSYSTTGTTVQINPDGTVEEVPCEEE